MNTCKFDGIVIPLMNVCKNFSKKIALVLFVLPTVCSFHYVEGTGKSRTTFKLYLYIYIYNFNNPARAKTSYFDVHQHFQNEQLFGDLGNFLLIKNLMAVNFCIQPKQKHMMHFTEAMEGGLCKSSYNFVQKFAPKVKLVSFTYVSLNAS